MNLYRYIGNKKLYTIEHVILDYKQLNRNAFRGIYATPYDGGSYTWNDPEVIRHTYQMYLDHLIFPFDPEKFVKDNFVLVSKNI